MGRPTKSEDKEKETAEKPSADPTPKSDTLSPSSSEPSTTGTATEPAASSSEPSSDPATDPATEQPDNGRQHGKTANPMNDGPNEAIARGESRDSVLAGSTATSGLATSVDSSAGGGSAVGNVRIDRDPRIVPEWDPNGEGGDERFVAMCAYIESYAAKSHGLTPDVELLKKIARHLRGVADLPDPE